MKKEKFEITGMTCSACSSRVQRAVEKLAGTRAVQVNLLTGSMQLEFDEEKTSAAAIIAAVKQAGYGAALPGRADAPAAPEKNVSERQAEELYVRLWRSVLFLLPVLYLSMHSTVLAWLGLPVPEIVREVFDGPENAVSFAFAQFLLVLPIMYLNRRFYIVGFRTLLQGAPNMDTLVGMGSMA